MSPAYWAAWRAQFVAKIGRLPTPDEVLEAVRWLVSTGRLVQVGDLLYHPDHAPRAPEGSLTLLEVVPLHEGEPGKS